MEGPKSKSSKSSSIKSSDIDYRWKYLQENHGYKLKEKLGEGSFG